MAFCLCNCAVQLGLELFQKVHAPQNGGGRSDEKTREKQCAKINGCGQI